MKVSAKEAGQVTKPQVEPLQVGPLRIDNPVVLAPMASVTNAPFRRLCLLAARRGLPADLQEQAEEQNRQGRPSGGRGRAIEGLYVNEMLTARALVEGNRRTEAMVKSGPEQQIRSLQLYGTDPDILTRATEILVAGDLVDHIDLNFGCPVPKVTRKGGGSALPWKLGFYTDTVAAVVRAAEKYGRGRPIPIPVTVKVRIGLDDEHLTYLDAARAAVNVGAAAVTLHARTTAQYYSGQARWEAISRLVEALPNTPVLGNGDIWAGADAQRMLRETGCAGVEIGRGAQGKPYLFEEITAHLWGQAREVEPNLAQVCEVIWEHARDLAEHFGSEEIAMRDMRKHLGWYLRGFTLPPGARLELARVATLEDLAAQLAQLDQSQSYPPAAKGKHGRAGKQHKVRLPEGWYDSREMDAAAKAALHLADLEDDESLTAGG